MGSGRPVTSEVCGGTGQGKGCGWGVSVHLGIAQWGGILGRGADRDHSVTHGHVVAKAATGPNTHEAGGPQHDQFFKDDS